MKPGTCCIWSWCDEYDEYDDDDDDDDDDDTLLQREKKVKTHSTRRNELLTRIYSIHDSHIVC